MAPGHPDVWLFSYGTLRQLDVQRALFGRALEGHSDVLRGYTVSPLRITDADVIAKSGTADHTVVHATGDPPIASAASSTTHAGRACRRRCV